MNAKLGIIGTGRIAKRFATDAWQGLPVEIVAVYNPHLLSAENFCKECNVGIPFDDWDRFIDQIDAAYVASPNGTHYDYVARLLEAKKNVLCEKPMVLRQQQAIELFELAKLKNCVLMEGIKTAYSPGFQKIMELVASGKIGEVKDVEACFTKLVETDSREWTNLQDGGSMTELGTYGCYAVTSILGCEPSDIRYVSIRNEAGIDCFTKIFFEYNEQAIGLVKSGIGVKSEGELIISGTKGYVLVRAPWWMPKQIEIHYEDTSKTEVYSSEYLGNGLQYELDNFLKRITKNAADEYVTEEQSIVLAKIMENFLVREKMYRTNNLIN